MGKLDKCAACQGLGNENIYQLCPLPASSAKYHFQFFRGIFPSPATSWGSGTGEEWFFVEEAAIGKEEIVLAKPGEVKADKQQKSTK